MPIYYGPGIERLAFEVEEAGEPLTFLLFPILIFPWLFAAVFTPCRKMIQFIAWISNLPVFFAVLSFIYLKMGLHDLKPGDSHSLMNNILMDCCIQIEYSGLFIFPIISIGLALLALPRIALGLPALWLLDKKNYHFNLWEATYMMCILGPFKIRRMPPLEVLATIPGFGGGSYDRIIDLVKATESGKGVASDYIHR